MIQGTGIDIIELERIEKLFQRNVKFVERVLTKSEQEKLSTFTNHKRRVEFLAGRFAVKEAYSKAVGTGIGKHLSFQSIEIISNDLGQPVIYVNSKEQVGAHVSISHSKQYAIAQVILEK
ncbi:holo-ACP synthase [Filobacillus milosensis]|uniref:Holo-[acyl-carrier-protein] synthase n=1 Tax=Filobacillus milosensis TaxID=94137 RepID=A0A4Y8IB86_9BACI|nr:holo-ACP synthase [Filobacillus milosensis]TFB13230.1 holo-ACP synthase [Filobacillus milosensis]